MIETIDTIEVKRLFTADALIHLALQMIEDVPEILRASGLNELARSVKSAYTTLEESCGELEAKTDEIRYGKVGA